MLTQTLAVDRANTQGAPSAQSELGAASLPTVHLKISAFVTEVGLEWVHYSPRLNTGVFSDASHLKVMQHNFSNVA